MVQGALLLPDFTLLGFVALVGLTMVAQQMNHGEAIIFLEQWWEWTGLGGVHPDQGDNRNPERVENDLPPWPDQDIPPLHDGNNSRWN